MTVIAVIPCRMNASRLPGKPLVDIIGMAMVHHCYLRAKLASKLDRVVVATCDEVIANSLNDIGAEVIMTSRDHERAMTRTAEAVDLVERSEGLVFEHVVMVQGDEPLVTPDCIDEIVKALTNDGVDIANLVTGFSSYEMFLNPNRVKVVVDRNSNALYLSREPIPSARIEWEVDRCFNQTGLIGFQRGVLTKLNNLTESDLERLESIDLLRALDNGIQIRMIPTQEELLGVDTSDDLEVVRQLMLNDKFRNRYLPSSTI